MMTGKCNVCKQEHVEIFEVETVNDEVIHCCNDCWDKDDEWQVSKEKDEVVVVTEKKPMRLNTKVSYDLNAWLDKKAEETGISKSALVAIAIENYRKETETVAALPALLKKLEEMGIEVGSPRQ